MNSSLIKGQLLALAFTLSICTNTKAQLQDNERVQSAKIAFITNKLNLSPKQAEQFWPLFNEFETKRKELRASKRESSEASPSEFSDLQAKEEIKKLLQAKQQEVDLEKEYVDKFMKAITPKQVYTLLQSEKEFTRMLVKRLQEKRKGRSF